MGANLRHIPWRFLGALCVGLLLCAGVVMLMGLVNKKDADQVCSSLQVVVEGKETFIDQRDIVTMVNNQHGNVVGRPIREIPIELIEKSLRQLPYVARAEVYVDMDGKMRISVHQRAIVLRVISQSGSDYYIDTEGRKIPTTLKYVPLVLVANGYIYEELGSPLDSIQSEIVQDLVRIVEHVGTDELWRNQVVQLYVNKNQDIEIVPRVGEQELIIGNAEDLADKLTRLEIFYKNILPKVGSEAYNLVNVKYDGQIICERNAGWYMDSLQMKLNTQQY